MPGYYGLSREARDHRGVGSSLRGEGIHSLHYRGRNKRRGGRARSVERRGGQGLLELGGPGRSDHPDVLRPLHNVPSRRLPPSVDIRLPAQRIRRYLLGINGHNHALRTETARAGRQDGRIFQGRRVQGDLVRPGVQHCAHALLVSYSSPDSEGNEYLLRATMSQPHDGLSLLVRGRNIQEYNFICTFTIIESSKLNGISGIPNVHKIRTLYYAALVHVQARDDSFQEHVNASRASFTVKRPSYSDLPTIT